MDHFDQKAECCEVCSEQIAEHMQDALCSACGVRDTSDADGEQGKLSWCESCMYTFCMLDGSAYSHECYCCEGKRMDEEDGVDGDGFIVGGMVEDEEMDEGHTTGQHRGRGRKRARI